MSIGTEYLNEIVRSQTVLVLAISFAITSAASTQLNNRSAKGLFQQRYDRLNRAIEIKDLTVLDALIAPDYSAGDYTHPMGKTQTLEAIKKFKGSAKVQKRTVLNVILNGKKATAIVDMVTEKHISDQKKDHVYIIATKSMDTWALNADWQLRHSQIIRQAVTKDGKPLPQRRLGG